MPDPEEVNDLEVTDEMLHAALAGGTPVAEPEPEPTAAPEPTPEPIKKDPEYSQEEGSRLGKKIAALEGIIGELSEGMKALLERKQVPEQRQSLDTGASVDDEMPEMIVTPADFEKYLEVKKRKEDEKFTKYSQDYVKALRLNFGSEDDYNEVVEVLKTTPELNKVSRGMDASSDAQLNYMRASKALLLKKLNAGRAPVNPLKGDPNPELAKGLSGSDKLPVPVAKTYKLDPAAQAYVDKMARLGTPVSEEEIAEAMEMKMPTNMMRY